MSRKTIQVKLYLEDYEKVRKARAAVEIVADKKIESFSEAIGLMADFWFKLYLKTLTKEIQEIPELLKAAESPLVKKLAEEWLKQ